MTRRHFTAPQTQPTGGGEHDAAVLGLVTHGRQALGTCRLAMGQRRDYGPTGCCQPWAVAVIAALAVISWGVVFTAVQIVRWIV